MANQRILITVNKKTSQVKHQKREIASLLENKKEEKARIKVEHIIREDFTIEGYELIELLTELVHERIAYIASEKECPADIKEAVCSLIWCSNKVPIAELTEVRKQLIKKYGKEFAKNADANHESCVNQRLFEKLMVKPPSSVLEIAAEYKVDWEPTDLGIEADSLGPVISPSGFSIPIAPCSSLNNAYRPPEKKSVEEERTFFPPPVIQNSNQSPSNIQAVKSLPPSAYNPAYNETLNTVPVVTLPVNNNESNKKEPPSASLNKAELEVKKSNGDEDDDDTSFDALQARFAALQNQ